jgi:putative transposase
MLEYNIRKGDVLLLLSLLMLEYNITSFTIRNDNGSQFIANVVREYLKEKGVTQEFTHVATPEENSYIETYHSIIQREVIERFEFESIHDAKAVFYRYNE